MRYTILNMRARIPLLPVLVIVIGLLSSAGWATVPVFLPPVNYNSGGLTAEAGFVAVADVDGDGKPDLVVANTYFSNSIGVLLGNVDGTFQPAVAYDSGGGFPVHIVVLDVNKDGIPDLVVLNQNPCYACTGDALVAILLGNGDGTFAPAVTYDAGPGLGTNIGGGPAPGQMAVGDLNGDGNPDVVVANCVASAADDCGNGSENGVVGVLLGNGNATFAPVVTYDSGGVFPVAVAIDDVNGDGYLDVLVSNNSCATLANCASGDIGVLLGNGNGTLQPAATYASAIWSLRQIVVTDINGDGKPDILVGGCAAADCFASSGVISILPGNGNGIFGTPQVYLSGGKLVNSIAVADFNGDSRLDIATVNLIDSSLSVFSGNGNGTFQPPVRFSSGSTFPYAVAAGDLNGDHKADLAVSSLDGPLITGCTYTQCCLDGPCAVVGVFINNTAFDTSPPVVTASATPKSLWPPKGQLVAITISGTITDTGSGVDPSSAIFAVNDEYGQIQPAGPITLGAGGAYSFIVTLQASRLGNDHDGRQYVITVSAKDNAGNLGSGNVVITVPHDQGH